MHEREESNPIIDAISIRSRARGGFVTREQFMPIARDLGVDAGKVLEILLHTQPHVYPEVPGVLEQILEKGGIPVFWTYGEIYRHQNVPSGYTGFQPWKLFGDPRMKPLIYPMTERAQSVGLELVHGSFDKMDKSGVIDPLLCAVAESRVIGGVTIADDVRGNVAQLGLNFGYIGRKPILYHLDRSGQIDRETSMPAAVRAIATLDEMLIRPKWLYVLDVDGTVVDTARLKKEWGQQFAQITS